MSTVRSGGLLVWNQRDPLLGLESNYLFVPVSLEDCHESDFCDYIFPILLRMPENRPLGVAEIDRITTQFAPGCYLVCAEASHASDTIDVLIYGTERKIRLTRLSANLHLVIYCANLEDRYFNQNEPIELIDDTEVVKGYFYPFRNCNCSVVQKSRTKIREYEQGCEMVSDDEESEIKEQYGVCRVLKRSADLVQLHCRFLANMNHLRGSFVAEKSDKTERYSERFNFVMSQDSYAVIIDHNSSGPSQARPHRRLIRSGAYISIEGNSRYADLSLASTNYLTRYIYLSRLTTHPLVILQEGVKAFDVRYGPDGLDFTLIDNQPPTSLIYVDWYQLQLDLKLDDKERHFKGHIMPRHAITDVLKTFTNRALEWEEDNAARLNLLDLMFPLEEERLRDVLLFSMQQVIYAHKDLCHGTLEVIWNVYYRIDDQHLETGNFSDPLYLYLKSFICVYDWCRATPSEPFSETTSLQVVISDLDVSITDLARAQWSLVKFNQLVPLYIGKMFPYQGSIKRWLLAETRTITEMDMIDKPTTLTEKLIYRNEFFAKSKNMVPSTRTIKQVGLVDKEKPDSLLQEGSPEISHVK